MITIFDNLTAMIIGSAVLLIMLNMQRQTQQIAVERTLNHVSTRHSIEFGRWIQEDLANVGAGVSQNAAAMQAPRVNADGLTREFSFWRKLDAGAASAVLVAYTLDLADTVHVQRGRQKVAMPLYRVRRTTDGQADGESMPTLTDFKIELLDGEGETTATPAEARYIRVQFSSVSRIFRESSYLHENHWATTVPLRR